MITKDQFISSFFNPRKIRRYLTSKIYRLARKLTDQYRDLIVGKYVTEILKHPPRNSCITVVCVVRNGMDHIRFFLDYHQSLGLRDFVFLLNNSTDGTKEYLLKQDISALLESSASYAKYENNFKRYLVKKYCTNSWCLMLDIDEHFIYPCFQGRSKIGDIVNYCDKFGYNAVATQMLDMFSSSSTDPYNLDLQDKYDLEDIQKHPYPDTIKLNNNYPDEFFDGTIPYYRHGIRWKLFGSTNGLTKISLLKYQSGMTIFASWHHCVNAKLADISCGIKHHPFSKSFCAKVADAVVTGRYGRVTSDEYRLYQEGIDQNSNIAFERLNPSELKNVMDLYNIGYLHISEKYICHTKNAQK